MPHKAYFGQKDAQQARVIQQMARDLNFPVEIEVCPTVREADGLAMSSRNAYLDPEERRAATVLYRALVAAGAAFEAGERDADRLRRIVEETIASEPLARLQYVSCAQPDTLQELETVSGRALLSLAAFVGRTRLIDNITLAANDQPHLQRQHHAASPQKDARRRPRHDRPGRTPANARHASLACGDASQ
jgi:pantoate--beta-alanine ligase